MKKMRILTSVALVIVFANVGLCQGMIEKGFIGGINYASFGGPDADDGDMDPKRLLRFTAGGFATFKFQDKHILRTEVHYSMKGVKYEESDSGVDLLMEMRMNYLDIPILYVINPQPKIKAYAGPSIGIYLNGEIYSKFSYDGDSDSDTEDIEKGDIASPDFGAVLGASYSINDKMSLDVRYTMGLMTIDDADDVDIKHNGLQLLLSTTF